MTSSDITETFSDKLYRIGLPALHIIVSTLAPASEGFFEGRAMVPRTPFPVSALPATLLGYMAGTNIDLKNNQNLASCNKPSHFNRVAYTIGSPLVATILYHISYDIGTFSTKFF